MGNFQLLKATVVKIKKNKKKTAIVVLASNHSIFSCIQLKADAKLLSGTEFCGVGAEDEDLVAARVEETTARYHSHSFSQARTHVMVQREG